MTSKPTCGVLISRIDGTSAQSVEDCIAVEEPLEIQLGYYLLGKPARRSISITMRTPGDDYQLALGFLYSEGIIAGPDDVDDLTHVGDEGQPSNQPTNIIRVDVNSSVDVDVGSLQRNFYTTSSCGVCGKASLEALTLDDCKPVEKGDWSVDAGLITELPDRLRRAQALFEKTGGIHAAGLFDESGTLIELREDVGRHNAMDKLVGARYLDDALPLTRQLLVLSGRASFELLQKALRAEIPVVVAVGAPSSLAVELADDFGITLVGFARGDRFNIYSHVERIR